MNRTFLFSVLGLCVLSAAGIAGSRTQAVSFAAQASSTSAKPVVIVKRADGTTLSAQEIHIVQDGSDPVVLHESGTPAQGPHVLQDESDPAVLHYSSRLEEGETADVIDRILVTRSRTAQAAALEAMQRAQKEAEAAQARARAAYDEAQRIHRELLQDAQARDRSQAERKDARRVRTHWAESERAQDLRQDSDIDAALSARVEALERAARERGLTQPSAPMPLEERVARLEQFMRSESRQPTRLRVKSFTSEPESSAPGVRVDLLPGTQWLVAPAPPVAQTPATPPTGLGAPAPPARLQRKRVAVAPEVARTTQREDLERALSELREEAGRMREELARMRREIDALPVDPRR